MSKSTRQIRQPHLPRWSSMLAILALSGPATARASADIKFGENGLLKIFAWGQVRAQVDAENRRAVGDHTFDLYVPRTLFLLKGQINKHVGFGISPCFLNLGRQGGAGQVGIADAYIDFPIWDELAITAGRFIQPFTRHGHESSAWLHGIDWHSALHQRRNDVMLMARGLVREGLFEYRLGLGDGVEPNDWQAPPRMFGRVGINLWDSDPLFYVKGTYLGTKRMLSFGAGFDVEPADSDRPDSELSWALAADALLDLPLGDNGITATLNYYLYGPGNTLPEGMGLWADAGYRIDKVEPLAVVEWYQPKTGELGKRLVGMAGVNWWLDGHNAHIKAQAGVEKLDARTRWRPRFMLQAGFLM